MVLDNMQGLRDGPGASEPRERRVLTRVVQLGSPVAPSRPGTEQGHRAGAPCVSWNRRHGSTANWGD